MEKLYHYVWKHRIGLHAGMTTTDGRQVDVIDPGLHNSDAGPDFFNAKVKIDGETWVGNVEIHSNASEWYTHGHDSDPAYDNVILHVIGNNNRDDILTHSGRLLPQLVIDVPDGIRSNYKELLYTDSYPPCYKVIPNLSRLMVHSWMAALQTERLQQKTEAILERLERLDGNWEAAYFATLARTYGFGKNGDALEQWACSIPIHAIDHHRDDLLQLEALFFGQAGMLNVAAVPERMKLETAADTYFQRLQQEYEYLRHKFRLTPIDPRGWQFMRMRPQNFPSIRIAQLARLHHESRAQLSRLLECDNIDKLKELLRCGVSEYWQTHYTFGHESTANKKMLSAQSINVLMINTAIPMLFAYGRHNCHEKYCQKAFDLLEQLKAEDNNIVRLWQEVGLSVENAGDTQALIQLKKQYCDRRDCLSCRFGYEYLKNK